MSSIIKNFLGYRKNVSISARLSFRKDGPTNKIKLFVELARSHQ